MTSCIDQFSAMTPEQARIFMAPHGKQEVRGLLARLVGDRSVLDIGCGKGMQVAEFFDPNRYIGIDCSPALIDLAREDNPGFEFRVADARELEGHWPCGIIKAVLENLTQPEAVEVYDAARRLCDVLYIAWATAPGTSAKVRTYDGELGTMQQNRHLRSVFKGPATVIKAPHPFTIWRVDGI